MPELTQSGRVEPTLSMTRVSSIWQSGAYSLNKRRSRVKTLSTNPRFKFVEPLSELFVIIGFHDLIVFVVDATKKSYQPASEIKFIYARCKRQGLQWFSHFTNNNINIYEEYNCFIYPSILVTNIYCCVMWVPIFYLELISHKWLQTLRLPKRHESVLNHVLL